jgi:hypothetical protein
VPQIEVRCAEPTCPHSQPGQGFPEDGLGGSADGMSAHSRQTRHKADGLYVDGERVVPGNRQTKMWLQNHGMLRRPSRSAEDGEDAGDQPIQDPSAGWPDEFWDDDPDDPDGGADGEAGDEGDAGSDPPARRAGRPPLPDLMRGYVLARDIPIDEVTEHMIRVRLHRFRAEYVDDAGEELPYGLAVARVIAEAVAFDSIQRPFRYPLERAMQERHVALLAPQYKSLKAREEALLAAEEDYLRRLRDLTLREQAAPRGASDARA